MRPEAGGATGASLPVLRQRRWVRTPASSAPTSQAAGQNTSMSKVYCARGRMENMFKEHKLYLKSDRTSCHRWEANQFRLILDIAAYWLMLRVRDAAPKKSQWRRATVESIRNTFLKIAARVAQMKTRIRVSFLTATPNIGVINTMLGKLAAQAR